MDIAIREEAARDLHAHTSISSTVVAHSVLHVQRGTDGALSVRERSLPAAFRKDYDRFEDPLSWPRTFDVARWTLLAAFAGPQRVGGVLLARDTAGVDMLEGRSDLAVVWDLRVAPAWRRRGVARALLRAGERWAGAHGCRELKVETQDTNLAACRLYERHGFVLAGATPGVYADLPDEVQLIWRKRLDA